MVQVTAATPRKRGTCLTNILPCAYNLRSLRAEVGAMQVNGEHLETAIGIAVEERRGGRNFASWRNAVTRGAELVLNNRCLPIGPTIILVMSDSGGYYVTDGQECRSTEGLCRAYEFERPCKHRAAHRLIQLLKVGAQAA